MKHGTTTGYSKYKCRCDECKKVFSEYRKALHERNPEVKRARAARYRVKYRERLREEGRVTSSAKRLEYQKFIDDMKAYVPCTDCHEAFPPECMDFDHVRGQKLFDISKGHTRNRDAVYTELARCEVVCSNCHRIRTRRRANE